MLDEPSLGLAPMLVEGLYDASGRVARRGHDHPAGRPDGGAGAVRSPTAPTCCQSGAIQQQGRAAELRTDPAVVQAYLGERQRTG